MTVGRVRDSERLATYSADLDEKKREQCESVSRSAFRKQLAAAQAADQLKPDGTTSVEWSKGKIFFLLSCGFLFCVTTMDEEFPEGVAYCLLQELAAKLREQHSDETIDSVGPNGLNEEMRLVMTELVLKYQDGKAPAAGPNAKSKGKGPPAGKSTPPLAIEPAVVEAAAAPAGTEPATNALPFIALGRVRDTQTLADYAIELNEEKREHSESVFKKLLAAAQTTDKLKPGGLTSLEWAEGIICFLLSACGGILYCVTTGLKSFPEDVAYRLLQELERKVKEQHSDEAIDSAGPGGLCEELRPVMKELALKYQDANLAGDVGDEDELF